MDGQHHLKCITYMCPDLPVEYYELILQYLEEKLNCFTELIYESRWSGPPEGRLCPFTEGAVDIAFMDTFSYFKCVERKISNVELLPISSVHYHSRSEDRPGYYADVITHIDLKPVVKNYLDLRGCKWTFSQANSICSHLITLRTLKESGERSTFFGNMTKSGSDIESIKMVVNKAADASCVDTNVLANYLHKNPGASDHISVLKSFGMLAPYPIIVNRNMKEKLKDSISTALLEMHLDPKWEKKLSSFNVRRFAKTTSSMYDNDKRTVDIAQSSGIPAYY